MHKHQRETLERWITELPRECIEAALWTVVKEWPFMKGHALLQLSALKYEMDKLEQEKQQRLHRPAGRGNLKLVRTAANTKDLDDQLQKLQLQFEQHRQEYEQY